MWQITQLHQSMDISMINGTPVIAAYMDIGRNNILYVKLGDI